MNHKPLSVSRARHGIRLACAAALVSLLANFPSQSADEITPRSHDYLRLQCLPRRYSRRRTSWCATSRQRHSGNDRAHDQISSINKARWRPAQLRRGIPWPASRSVTEYTVYVAFGAPPNLPMNYPPLAQTLRSIPASSSGAWRHQNKRALLHRRSA